MVKDKFKFIREILITIAVLLILSQTILAADTSGNGVQELGSTIVSGSTNATNYFYMQLNNRERKFYHALETMAGVKSCGESHDVSGKQFYSGSDLDLTAGDTAYKLAPSDFYVGRDQLLQEMVAARDAFQYDHPEVFYIDWSLLSLRVFETQNGNKATLGVGRSNTYYLPGFNSSNIADKVSEFNTLLDQAKTQVEKDVQDKLTGVGDNVKQRLIATQAHDYVTQNMVYHFEHEVHNFGQGEYSNARTAYDALKYHEGVCESYTRLYKVLMDKLNIPTICVTGNYHSEDGTNEPHIWNYVELPDQENPENGNFCFVVDTTMDDPIKIDKNYIYNDGQPGHWEEKLRTPAGKELTESDLKSGGENNYLCLVGSAKVLMTHNPSPYLSAGTKAFGYPRIITSGYGEVAVQEGNGFKVKQVKSEDTDGDYTEFLVSYNKKDYSENAQDGKYIIIRFGQHSANGTMEYSDWCYPEVEMYMKETGKCPFEPKAEDPDLGHYLRLPFPQVEWIQFAITNMEPPYIKLQNSTDKEDINKWFFYQGDPKCLIDASPEITNSRDIYYAPPYVVEAKPQSNGSLNCNVDKPYRIEITYDDVLVTQNEYHDNGLKAIQANASDLGLQLYKKNNIDWINRKIDNPKISNVKIETVQIKDNSTWKGEAQEVKAQASNGTVAVSKVSFDFIPDKTYADQDALYSFIPAGVVGRRSGKQANSCGYYFGYPVSCCPIIANERNEWDVFGYPRLLDSSLFNPQAEGLETSDGQALGLTDYDFQKITHRLQLVIDEPSKDWDPQDTHSSATAGSSAGSKSQQQNLKDALKEQITEESSDVKKVDDNSLSFYNIALSLCKKMIIHPGQKVKVCVGFPSGYSYDSLGKGTTFKAYHYKLDKTKDPVSYELEEIKCEVTPLGLIIECDSFSPFAIAEVELTDAARIIQENQTTISFLTIGDGGIFENGIKQVDSVTVPNLNSEKTYSVQADANHVIDQIKINGVIQKLDKSGLIQKDISIGHNNAENGAILIEATFIPASTEASEEAAGKIEKVATPANEVNFSVSAASDKGDNSPVNIGDSLTLTGSVENFDSISSRGTLTYVWKKGGVIVQQGPQKDLHFNSVNTDTGGSYTLEVIYKLDGEEKTVAASPVHVSVAGGSSTYDPNTVLVHLDPPEGGSITIDNASSINNYKEYDSNYTGPSTVKAVARANYKFTHFTLKGSDQKITENPYIISSVNKDYELTAHFEFNGNIEIKVKATPEEGGSVKILGEAPFTPGEEVDLVAQANSGFKFVGWKIEGRDQEIVSSDPTYRLTVAAENYPTFIAVFEVSSEPAPEVTGVTIEGSDKIAMAPNTTQKLTAVLEPEGAVGEIKWFSSNNKVVAVSPDGTIKALEEGEVTISATCGQYKASITVTVSTKPVLTGVPVYRLYNPVTSEHLYTSSKGEYDILAQSHGWNQEGVGWSSPESGIPVYRLYNPGLGDHLYTTSEYEKEVLIKDWNWTADYDGEPLFYSTEATYSIPIYRLYNDSLGRHLLTRDFDEYNELARNWGWSQEDVAFRALS